MSLQSYEYGLSPHDGFKVYRQFQFNHNHHWKYLIDCICH